MREWEVELLRKVDGGYVSINKIKVWEFDDECLEYNLWAKSVQEFKDEIIENDVIKINGYHIDYIKYNDDGTGTFINIR